MGARYTFNKTMRNVVRSQSIGHPLKDRASLSTDVKLTHTKFGNSLFFDRRVRYLFEPHGLIRRWGHGCPWEGLQYDEDWQE
jgi:hypothetical protein